MKGKSLENYIAALEAQKEDTRTIDESDAKAMDKLRDLNKKISTAKSYLKERERVKGKVVHIGVYKDYHLYWNDERGSAMILTPNYRISFCINHCFLEPEDREKIYSKYVPYTDRYDEELYLARKNIRRLPNLPK